MTDPQVEQSYRRQRQVLARDVDDALRSLQSTKAAAGAGGPQLEICENPRYATRLADGFTLRIPTANGVLSLRLEAVASSWAHQASRGRSRSPRRGRASQRV